jgi:hypothetical protein
MNDTIRAYISSRKRRTLVTVAVGVALVAPATACVLADPGASRYQPVLLAIGGCGLLTMAAGLLYLDRTRCPRCLGQIGPGLYMRASINYCPHCGVSLDAPAY